MLSDPEVAHGVIGEKAADVCRLGEVIPLKMSQRLVRQNVDYLMLTHVPRTRPPLCSG